MAIPRGQSLQKLSCHRPHPLPPSGGRESLGSKRRRVPVPVVHRSHDDQHRPFDNFNLPVGPEHQPIVWLGLGPVFFSDGGQRKRTFLGHRAEHDGIALCGQHHRRCTSVRRPGWPAKPGKRFRLGCHVQWLLPKWNCARTIFYWQAYFLDKPRDSVRDLHHLPG